MALPQNNICYLDRLHAQKHCLVSKSNPQYQNKDFLNSNILYHLKRLKKIERINGF